VRRSLGLLAADQAGMSLAEILVACVIIAIGLVGLLAAVPTASYGIQEGRQLSTATFLANQRLEQARNSEWTSTPDSDCLGKSASAAAPPTAKALSVGPPSQCDGAAVTSFPDEGPMAAPYADYSRTVRITDCSVAPGCGLPLTIYACPDQAPFVSCLREVTVTVSYRASTATGIGTTKSAIVSMLIALR
jgi:type II secretory pathway pseudopilin PulG